MNIDEFISEVEKLGLNLSINQINQFKEYASFLKEYNEHTNLTSITDDEDIYLKHFYDSLTVIDQNIVDFNNVHSLIDVGTGAGFPGMVLKIAFPSIEVTLLDSNNKKTKFLEELVKKLIIDNISIINERSEVFAKNNLDSFDIVVSRAVANLNILSELCLPLVKDNGYFLALKGNVSEELEESKDKISKLNGTVEFVKTFKLIKEEANRNIVFIRKQGKTPLGYPRDYNKIKREYEKKHLVK